MSRTEASPATGPRPAELRVALPKDDGSVGALLLRPADAAWLLVLGHGAGAGMRHPFLERLCERLAARRIATLRYQFPYMEAGRRRPDHARRLEATARAAICRAEELAPDLELLAGGKSMGGRMTSRAVATDPPERLRGLVFFGFPLHPAGKPGVERAEHLLRVRSPMLFLQGDRDRLAELDLLRPVCGELGRRATLRVVAGADHGFHVLKRSGRSDEEVLDELARETAAWATALATRSPVGPPGLAR